VAEIPLVGTRFQFRRRGMCRVLMNMLEKVNYNLFFTFASFFLYSFFLTSKLLIQ
jgi:hypothetical protein